jgi:hypothetical protein
VERLVSDLWRNRSMITLWLSHIWSDSANVTIKHLLPYNWYNLIIRCNKKTKTVFVGDYTCGNVIKRWQFFTKCGTKVYKGRLYLIISPPCFTLADFLMLLSAFSLWSFTNYVQQLVHGEWYFILLSCDLLFDLAFERWRSELFLYT